MFGLIKLVVNTILVGVVGCVVSAGLVGLLIGAPLAFFELLPGDDLDSLRQLPRNLVVAGFCGLGVGCVGGFAAQWTGGRVNNLFSSMLVAGFALTTIYMTHPNLNLTLDSTVFDYLNSYRLTILATLAGGVAVIVVGQLLRPFQSADRETK